ncbi:conserved hypothetical protein [Beggiatoa sp. PS]|nr:conserved hypothetical protein [Beggiatoa sp. PS]
MLIWSLNQKSVQLRLLVILAVFYRVDKMGDTTDRGSVGYLKASPDGNRLALAVSLQEGFFEVFDFDNETGQVSNPIPLPGYEYPYGVEFSPDGTKLYGSLIEDKTIYQFDLPASDRQDFVQLVGSSRSKLGALQIAPDGKIYVARFNGGYLGVINNPNRLGRDSHYVDDGFYLAGRNSKFGLPTLFESFPQSEICQLYGVHDDKRNDSQLFTVSPETLEVKALGDLKIAYDLEALDNHPQTAELFAASGKDTDKPGYLYTVDKTTGGLTEIGPMGFKEIDGISFAPDGTLWGWASSDGLVTIDTQSGQATLVVSYAGEVEDLTWNIAGTILYGVGNLVDGAPDVGIKLLAYDITTGRLNVICEEQTLGAEIEALDTLPDDTLIFGIHGKRNLTLGAINPETCQIMAAQEIVTDYNDIEGIAWPSCQ